MVSRDRAFLSDLAQQSRMARRNAREADYARDRLETLLRAATGSAIMGVDPAGTVTFFSAGAEQMLGYRAAEVVGIRSIADFIDPAQIDERRQTIDAMRTALEPVDAETAAEVPWTATRKDGQQRRCVVRVRALPVPTPDTALDDEWGDEGAYHDEPEGSADASSSLLVLLVLLVLARPPPRPPRPPPRPWPPPQPGPTATQSSTTHSRPRPAATWWWPST